MTIGCGNMLRLGIRQPNPILIKESFIMFNIVISITELPLLVHYNTRDAISDWIHRFSTSPVYFCCVIYFVIFLIEWWC